MPLYPRDTSHTTNVVLYLVFLAGQGGTGKKKVKGWMTSERLNGSVSLTVGSNHGNKQETGAANWTGTATATWNKRSGTAPYVDRLWVINGEMLYVVLQ